MINSNPWATIWTQPRATISKIVAENPNRSLWWLASIYGFSSVLNFCQSFMLGFSVSLPGIFLLAIVFAPLWGYVAFSVWSYVVSITGRWLKGAGTFTTVRSAYAWSCVPLIANIPLWFILAWIFGAQLFTTLSENYLLTDGQVTILFGVLIVRIGAAIWSLVIYLTALAEVQQFSLLRAIGNVLISGVIIGLVAYILLILLFSLAGPSPAAFIPFLTLLPTGAL